MRRAVEFHDSVVERSALFDGTFVLSLSAYVHASQGEPGIAAGDGYVQPVELRFKDAVVGGSIEVGEISDASVWIDDDEYLLMPLPFKTIGKVLIDIVFVSGARGSVRSGGVACEATGPERWVESYDAE